MILLAILILVIIVIAIEIKEFRKAPIKLTKKTQRDNDVKAIQPIQLKLKLCDQYKGGAAPNSNNPPPNTGSK